MGTGNRQAQGTALDSRAAPAAFLAPLSGITRPEAYIKPPRKLLRKCVAAEKALWVGCGSGEQEGESSAHRGPDVRKRTPVEDAAGRQTHACQRVESVELTDTKPSNLVHSLVSLWNIKKNIHR